MAEADALHSDLGQALVASLRDARDAQNKLSAAITRFEQIQMAHLSPDAAEAYSRWATGLEELVRAGDRLADLVDVSEGIGTAEVEAWRAAKSKMRVVG